MARTTKPFILLLISLITEIVTALSLPAVTGKYNVGTIQFALTDYSRSDPSAPEPNTPRSIMVQLFYPAQHTKNYTLAPYLTPGMAPYVEEALGWPNGTVSEIKTNSYQRAPIIPCTDIPTVIFSHGFTASRTIYTTLVEDLASHGYLVVSIDHPYDAGVVEFPDGHLVFIDPAMLNATTEQLLVLLDVRVRDVQFTLDGLQRNLTALIPGVQRRLRILEAGMFGHSFGGAAAANVMLADARFSGGLDMDGTVYGAAAESGFDGPFVLMGVPEHNLDSDTTWPTLWENLRGWKRALVLAGAKHLTYSDVGLLARLFNTTLTGDVDVGTIDPLRANQIQRTYIRAFFDYILKGKEEGVYDGPDAEYPEISFQY